MATDEQVFAAIAEVANRHGPAATTLARVGAQAGVTAAALVQRFGSKRAMLLANATHAATATSALFPSEDSERSPLETLRTVVRSMTPQVRSHKELANNVAFLQLDLTDREIRDLARQRARTVDQGIRKLLDRSVAAGELATCDTGALSGVVQAVCNGALFTWTVSGHGRIGSWVTAHVDAVIEPHRVREPTLSTEEPRQFVAELAALDVSKEPVIPVPTVRGAQQTER